MFSEGINVFCVLLFVLGNCCEGDYVAQSVVDQVGGGNYTYYKLNQPGELFLLLTSSKGDADLYVSSELEQPTFSLEEHSLSSTTCGEDKVEITASMVRPVNIAVYGHPGRSEVSAYRLDVWVVERTEFDPFKAAVEEAEEEENRRNGKARGEGGGRRKTREREELKEESLLQIMWPILKSIFEILIDVAL